MKTGTKSGLFLMELLLTLLLFALCAAICMQVFAFASHRADDTEDLSKGVFAASSAAECYKSCGGDLQVVAATLGGRVTDGTLTIDYDDQWMISTTSIYTLTMTDLDDGSASIVVTADDSRGQREIYSLTVRTVMANA